MTHEETLLTLLESHGGAIRRIARAYAGAAGESATAGPLQLDVLAAVPGDPGYNPWWRVVAVIINDGRDVSVDPYTSEAELLAAEAAGDVTFIDTGFVFLCQVLPGKNR